MAGRDNATLTETNPGHANCLETRRFPPTAVLGCYETDFENHSFSETQINPNSHANFCIAMLSLLVPSLTVFAPAFFKAIRPAETRALPSPIF